MRGTNQMLYATRSYISNIVHFVWIEMTARRTQCLGVLCKYAARKCISRLVLFVIRHKTPWHTARIYSQYIHLVFFCCAIESIWIYIITVVRFGYGRKVWYVQLSWPYFSRLMIDVANKKKHELLFGRERCFLCVIIVYDAQLILRYIAIARVWLKV